MNRSGAILVTALLLGACGQTPVAQVSTSSGSEALQAAHVHPGAKPFGEILKEPGWIQTSEGFWERPTHNGHESIFMGSEGAQRALQEREAFLMRMAQDMAGQPGAEERRARFDSHLAGLRESIERANTHRPGELQLQNIRNCTYARRCTR